MASLSGIGICFDVDGTLYPVSKWKIAWKLRKQFGLLRAMHRSRETMRTNNNVYFTHKEFLEAEAELVGNSLDEPIEKVVEQLADLKPRLADVMTRNTKPFPGVLDCLDWATAQGATMSILSDYSPDQKLANLGLQRVNWTACLGAEECGALKPHPVGFNRIREACGEHIRTWIYIGDREDTDILGAQSSDFVPVLFSSEKSHKAGLRLESWKLVTFQALIGQILGSEA